MAGRFPTGAFAKVTRNTDGFLPSQWAIVQFNANANANEEYTIHTVANKPAAEAASAWFKILAAGGGPAQHRAEHSAFLRINIINRYDKRSQRQVMNALDWRAIVPAAAPATISGPTQHLGKTLTNIPVISNGRITYITGKVCQSANANTYTIKTTTRPSVAHDVPESDVDNAAAQAAPPGPPPAATPQWTVTLPTGHPILQYMHKCNKSKAFANATPPKVDGDELAAVLLAAGAIPAAPARDGSADYQLAMQAAILASASALDASTSPTDTSALGQALTPPAPTQAPQPNPPAAGAGGAPLPTGTPAPAPAAAAAAVPHPAHDAILATLAPGEDAKLADQAIDLIVSEPNRRPTVRTNAYRLAGAFERFFKSARVNAATIKAKFPTPGSHLADHVIEWMEELENSAQGGATSITAPGLVAAHTAAASSALAPPGATLAHDTSSGEAYNIKAELRAAAQGVFSDATESTEFDRMYMLASATPPDHVGLQQMAAATTSPNVQRLLASPCAEIAKALQGIVLPTIALQIERVRNILDTRIERALYGEKTISTEMKTAIGAVRRQRLDMVKLGHLAGLTDHRRPSRRR